MKKVKLLMVSGRFDNSGGKPSGYARKLFRTFIPSGDLPLIGPIKFDEDDDNTVTFKYEYANQAISLSLINGGFWEDLATHILEHIQIIQFDVIIWMPDIPNDKPKLLRQIKSLSPKTTLVISKRNDGHKYSFPHLVARALQARANLFIEFFKHGETIKANLFDPLANIFAIGEGNIQQLGIAIQNRLKELLGLTRHPSIQAGDAIEVPDKKEFFEIVQQAGDRFHSLVHVANQTRFLGNASFRCVRGFPSFRGDNGQIFVSRRNVDKRYIDREHFVAVKLSPEKSPKAVLYYGDHKPSVDTPIQLRLYQTYPSAYYMIHGHVYVRGAPMTEQVLPCGAIEESDEIIRAVSTMKLYGPNFSVNLRGHGSIVVANNLDFLRNVQYEARGMPERQF